MAGKIILTTVYGRRVLVHIDENNIEHIRVISDTSLYPIGTVIVGRVKKMLPSSNACFVDLGNGIDYFMTIPSIPGSIIYADDNHKGKISCEDKIIVRISSEKIKSKAPTVDTAITLTGRYAVVENGSGLSFSKKISVQDKKRFEFTERLNFISQKCHIIVRTQASELSDFSELYAEIEKLYSEYESIISKGKHSVLYSVLYKPESTVYTVVSDWIKYDIDEIITDEEQFLDLLNSVISDYDNLSVRFYSDDNLDLYKLYKLESMIDEIIGKKVYLRSGGFLVVEQGETLTAIDVNSGHAIKGNKEDTIFKVNLEAAIEIGRILKNRNISGMILIDFINMKDASHERSLIETIKQILLKDDVKAKYVDMTGLGLVEITRQRVYMPFIEQWKS